MVRRAGANCLPRKAKFVRFSFSSSSSSKSVRARRVRFVSTNRVTVVRSFHGQPRRSFNLSARPGRRRTVVRCRSSSSTRNGVRCVTYNLQTTVRSRQCRRCTPASQSLLRLNTTFALVSGQGAYDNYLLERRFLPLP